MIKPNWNKFKAKFNDNPEYYFEYFCYLLFCLEFDKPQGIFRYKNQSGIEWNPIEVNGKIIVAQCKFYDNKLGTYKKDLLKMLDTIHNKYPKASELKFYTNRDWGQGKEKDTNDSKPKIEVEERAKEYSITIDWRTNEKYFLSPNVALNQEIVKHFFTDESIYDLVYDKQQHTERILGNIYTEIKFNSQIIELDRSKKIEELKSEILKNQVLILTGVGGVGKTAIIKKLYEEEKDKTPFYIFKASEFDLPLIDNLFGKYSLQRFIDIHDTYEEKIMIIDSSEKLLDIDNLNPFNEFLSALVKNKWEIIFTTRDNYLEDLQYRFTDLGITAPTIHIKNLTQKELSVISNSHNFILPEDIKLKELIENPFYLNEYLRFYDKDKGLDYQEFKEKLWNNNIKKSKPEREKCFLDLALKRANEGKFYIDIDGSSNSVNALLQDGILGDEISGYFITHDIYEEWALEKIVEQEFINRDCNLEFFKSIGNALPIRRSFRNWVSEKLLFDSEDIKSFIEDIIDDNTIELFWKDEFLISILLSNYSDTFFENFERELLVNNYALLKRISFLLRLACKEADNSPLGQYNLNMNSVVIFSMFNKPKGNGWKSFINFIYKHIDTIVLQNFNIISPVLYDWNSKQPNNDVTRFSTLIALEYYQEGHESDKIVQIIIAGALTIEDKLIAIFDDVIKNKIIGKNSKYYELIKIILTSQTSIVMYQKTFRESILKLCDLFWYRKPKNHDNDIHGHREKRYCLGDEHDFQYFPSHAYKTPIYWFLKVDMIETINFILEFTNKVIECYMSQNNDNSTIEIELSINESIIKQYHNIELWTAYRGRGNTTYLFESIHMGLELFLLEQAKLLDGEHLEILLRYILLKSKSSSISAVVGSIVLAYPEKTFNIAMILFSAKEFIIYDNSRIVNESIGSIDIFDNYNNDIWYEIAMKRTNEYKHRKNSLESLFRNYQFFADKDMHDEIFEERQEELWKLLDNYKNNLDASDTTWRFCLGRIDRRDMSPTVEKHEDGQVISFNPKLDEDLIEISKQSTDSLADTTKYMPLSQWSRYKFEHDDKYKEYPEYTENPKVAIEQIKEILSLSAQAINQYHFIEDETPCNACCALMRDYKKELSVDDKNFCRDTLITIAEKKSGTRVSEQALNYLPYMIKDFDDKKIKKMLHDFLFIGYSVNLDIWDLSYEDALSLLIGYLVLRPKYLALKEEENKKLHEKNYYAHLDEDVLLDTFKNTNAPTFDSIIQNSISMDEIKEYKKIDVYTLMKAFEFMPNVASSDDLKDISKNIILIVSSELLADKKDNFGFQEIDNFLSKLSYIVLNLNQVEIKDYLSPFIDGFNGSKIFSKLFLQFIFTQDRLNKYDNFWYIWELFEEKIIELCKDGDKYWHINTIIKTYFLAWGTYGNIWKNDSKDWHSLKEKNIRFLKKVSSKIGHCPSALYSISKLFTDIGSPYLNVGIGWISVILKDNKNLLIDELEPNTILDIENVVRKYILENSQEIKKQKIKKCEVIEILNFLVERGSAIGYMLRERIL